jgi:hypothetical protein
VSTPPITDAQRNAIKATLTEAEIRELQVATEKFLIAVNALAILDNQALATPTEQTKAYLAEGIAITLEIAKHLHDIQTKLLPKTKAALADLPLGSTTPADQLN